MQPIMWARVVGSWVVCGALVGALGGAASGARADTAQPTPNGDLPALRVVDLGAHLEPGWDSAQVQVLPYDEDFALLVWQEVKPGERRYDTEAHVRFALARLADSALGEVQTVEGELVGAASLGRQAVWTVWASHPTWDDGAWFVLHSGGFPRAWSFFPGGQPLRGVHPLDGGAVALWGVEYDDWVPQALTPHGVQRWPDIAGLNTERSPEWRSDPAAWAVAECGSVPWMVYDDGAQLWARSQVNVKGAPAAWHPLTRPPEAPDLFDGLTITCDGHTPYAVALVGEALWSKPLSVTVGDGAWRRLNAPAERPLSLTPAGAVLSQSALERDAKRLVFRPFEAQAMLGAPTLLHTLSPPPHRLSIHCDAASGATPDGTGRALPRCLLATTAHGRAVARGLWLLLPDAPLPAPDQASLPAHPPLVLPAKPDAPSAADEALEGCGFASDVAAADRAAIISALERFCTRQRADVAACEWLPRALHDPTDAQRRWLDDAHEVQVRGLSDVRGGYDGLPWTPCAVEAAEVEARAPFTLYLSDWQALATAWAKDDTAPDLMPWASVRLRPTVADGWEVEGVELTPARAPGEMAALGAALDRYCALSVDAPCASARFALKRSSDIGWYIAAFGHTLTLSTEHDDCTEDSYGSYFNIRWQRVQGQWEVTSIYRDSCYSDCH